MNLCNQTLLLTFGFSKNFCTNQIARIVSKFIVSSLILYNKLETYNYFYKNIINRSERLEITFEEFFETKVLCYLFVGVKPLKLILIE
jgi:hypothetical protein